MPTLKQLLEELDDMGVKPGRVYIPGVLYDDLVAEADEDESENPENPDEEWPRRLSPGYAGGVARSVHRGLAPDLTMTGMNVPPGASLPQPADRALQAVLAVLAERRGSRLLDACRRFFHRKDPLQENAVWGLWLPRGLRLTYTVFANDRQVPISVLVRHVLIRWVEDNWQELLQNKEKELEFGRWLVGGCRDENRQS